jgi:hypothetical protein
MPAYTQKAFLTLAATHNVAVEYQPAYIDRWSGLPYPAYILVDAPHRYVFRQTGLHCDGSLASTLPNGKIDWSQSYLNLQTLIKEGIEPCDDPNCDICGLPEDD